MYDGQTRSNTVITDGEALDRFATEGLCCVGLTLGLRLERLVEVLGVNSRLGSLNPGFWYSYYSSPGEFANLVAIGSDKRLEKFVDVGGANVTELNVGKSLTEVCKTSIRWFESHPRLQDFKCT